MKLRPDIIRVTVIGINPDHLDDVFNAFRKADKRFEVSRHYDSQQVCMTFAMKFTESEDYFADEIKAMVWKANRGGCDILIERRIALIKASECKETEVETKPTIPEILEDLERRIHTLEFPDDHDDYS